MNVHEHEIIAVLHFTVMDINKHERMLGE